MLSKLSLEAIDKVLSDHDIEISEKFSGYRIDRGKFKLLNLDPKQFSNVLLHCPTMEEIINNAKIEDPGNDRGWTIVSIVCHFLGFEASMSKIVGWAKTPEDWVEINKYVEKGYHPPTCRSLIERGLCDKSEPCSNKRGQIGGIYMNPSPILYANPEYVALVYNNVEGIDLSPNIPTSQKTLVIENAYKRKDSVFLHGKNLVVFNGNKLFVISTPDDLQKALSIYFEFFQLTVDKDGNERLKYFLPERSFLVILLHKLREAKFRKLNFFSMQPVLAKDGSGYKLIKAGFDSDTGILVVPQDEYRGSWADSMNILDTLLSSFKFRSKADRANFIASLLTPFLSNLFPGMVPLIHIEGNQKGLGKTAAGNALGYIYLGEYPVSLGLSDNEAEIEKHMCSGLKIGKYIYLFDNVKACKTLPLLGGPTLERFLTSRVLQFRLLGGNEIFEVENNLLLIVTTNGINVSEDILSRRIIIEMFSEGDSSAIQFSIPDLDEFLRENLLALRHALVSMIEYWIEQAAPLTQAKHRFRNWSMVIGGILQANRIEGFLENQSENKSSSKLSREFEKFLSLIPKGERLTAKNIYDKIHSKSPEFSSVDGVAAFAKKIISPLLGETFISGGRRYVFEKCGLTSDKSSLYQLKASDEQEQQELAKILPLHAKEALEQVFGVNPEEVMSYENKIL